MQNSENQRIGSNSINSSVSSAPVDKSKQIDQDRQSLTTQELTRLNLDRFAIEDVVEFKIARFFDQLGSFYPENVYDLIMAKVEKPLLAQILRRVGGNQVHAAKILGINRNTLRKKMRVHGLGL